jgi:hypothetical protein
MFTEWADRWQGYVCAWVSMPLYRGLYIGDFRLDSDEASVDPASACS